MGKVTELVAKIRSQDTVTLLSRFKHIVGAQAIRTYMASKPDPNLDVEVRLTEEEVLTRMLAHGPKAIKSK